METLVDSANEPPAAGLEPPALTAPAELPVTGQQVKTIPETRRVRYSGKSGASIEAAGREWNVNAPDEKDGQAHPLSPVKDLPVTVAFDLVTEHNSLFYYED